MEHWYTLYTKPNAEYQVTAALQERGILTYLPEIESSAHEEQVKKPFFPCYLFVKIDFEIHGLSLVQWTPGLRQVVAFDNQPVPLADEIIELIRHKVSLVKTGDDRWRHNFQSGDVVQITGGPFQDMLAVFDGPTTPSKRVHVLLNILGHASRVKVAATDLEKALGGAEALTLKRPRRTRGRGRYIN